MNGINGWMATFAQYHPKVIPIFAQELLAEFILAFNITEFY